MKKLIVILCAALIVVVVGAMSINAAQKGYEWKNRPGYTSAYVDVNGDGRCDHWTDNDHCHEYHANHHQHGYHHGR